jgi:hypothetical protein
MGAPKLMRLLRVKGCVNSSEHYIRAASAGHSANFVAAERIRRMNADTDNVARTNLTRIHSTQGLIDKEGIAEAVGRCRRKHSDDRSTESDFAWVNQVDAHAVLPSFLLIAGSRHLPCQPHAGRVLSDRNFRCHIFSLNNFVILKVNIVPLETESPLSVKAVFYRILHECFGLDDHFDGSRLYRALRTDVRTVKGRGFLRGLAQ